MRTVSVDVLCIPKPVALREARAVWQVMLATVNGDARA